MNKIRVGIFGYGNLGKAVEELIINDERFELVCIFSRRMIKSKHNNRTDFVGNAPSYKEKIDIMFLCGGSSSDLMPQSRECLKNFNCIDAFDTHAQIDEHITSCNELALANNKVAFCSFGWDPGLFSLMRILFNALGLKTYTAWGKGVSQGHTEAIKCLKWVSDAVQYTLPNKTLIKRIKKSNLSANPSTKDLHFRQCYVCADKKYYSQIKEQIVTMPNYFAGNKTKVNFITSKQMQKHKQMAHAGEVFCEGDAINFKIKTKSNPHFTAQIMLAYAIALKRFINEQKYGAYSILDIPLKSLLENSKEYLWKLF